MKKVFLFLAILFLGITASACKSKEFKYEKLSQVTYKEILNISESKYLVVAYMDDCSNCDKLKSTIEAYSKYQKKHDCPTLYGIKVTLDINKDMVLGKGEDYETDMIGTKNYEDIKIKATPALLVIEKGVLTKIFSDYTTYYPVTEATNYLNSLMD